MMIETCEARQLFSVTTVDAAAPTDTSSEPPPVVVDADAVAKKRKVPPQDINFMHLYDKASPVLA